MEAKVPEEILHGEPGLYTFTANDEVYEVIVGEIVDGEPIGLTIHGGGSGGGYYDFFML